MALNTLNTIEPYLAENAEASLNDWWRFAMEVKPTDFRPPPWAAAGNPEDWKNSLFNNMIQRQVRLLMHLCRYMFDTNIFI